MHSRVDFFAVTYGRRVGRLRFSLVTFCKIKNGLYIIKNILKCKDDGKESNKIVKKPFFYGTGIYKQTCYLTVSNYRRLWTPATLESSQVRCPL